MNDQKLKRKDCKCLGCKIKQTKFDFEAKGQQPKPFKTVQCSQS